MQLENPKEINDEDIIKLSYNNPPTFCYPKFIQNIMMGPLITCPQTGRYGVAESYGTCRGHVSDRICWYFGKGTVGGLLTRSTLKKDWFDRDFIPVMVGVQYTYDLRLFGPGGIVKIINWMEDRVGIKERTTVKQSQFKNIVLFMMPNIFIQASPLWSLWSLLLRVGRDYHDHSDTMEPDKYLDMLANNEQIVGNNYLPPDSRFGKFSSNWWLGALDVAYLKNALKCIEAFKEYGVSPEGLRTPPSSSNSHDWGIGKLTPQMIKDSVPTKPDVLPTDTKTILYA